MSGKIQNFDPMWKVVNKEVDLGAPTSFFDHVYLVCTQKQCEIIKDIVDNYRTIVESRISAGELKNHHARKICVFLRGPTIWKAMPRNVWNDIVSWHTKRFNNSTKYELHALTTIVKSMLLNCFEMLALGTYWTTRYSTVSEQFCTVDHEMDQSL